MRAQRQTEICAITNPEWSPQIGEVLGRFVEASNATLLAETDTGARVVYKPVAGVRELWDFPSESLAKREVWTYRLSEALGFDLVPETTIADGPYGLGAVQRFVEANADDTVIDAINRCDGALWPVAVLDVVTNNADRKAGHILRSERGRIWAIDHGLTFHAEPKLRTILWCFAGKEVPEELRVAVEGLENALRGELGAEFARDLSPQEFIALQERVRRLLAEQRHPDPPEDRRAIPWPPY